MRLLTLTLIALLVASGCARDEFGSRDSGSALDLPEPSTPTDNSANNTTNEPPQSGGLNNSNGPDPVGIPDFGQGYEGVSDTTLQAVEAVTRATFTDASATAGNVVFSPLALTNTLTIAALGGDVQTRQAIASRLSMDQFEEVAQGLAGLASSSTLGAEFSTLPTVWVEPGTALDPGFINATVPGLVRDVRFADFSSADIARQTINNYYRTQTDGRISSVLGPLALQPGDGAAIVDGVYFDANWETAFDPDETAEGTFQADGGDVQVAFMQRTGDFFVQRTATYEAIVVPYASTYDLVIVQPNSAPARAEIETKFSVQFLTDVVDESVPEQTFLKMPKIEVEGRLESALHGDVVANAVEREGGLESSGIEQATAMAQRAVIAFDERATTAIVPNTDAAENPSASVRGQMMIDRPFLFAVRERSTGILVLAGRVMRP
ncbi:MAG: serpin family protein [bacterium]